MTLNRSLFISIVGLLFIVLFVPLFVSNSMFFPFITGKNFMFRIVVEVATFLWVILALRDKKYRPTFSWLSISIAIFIAVIGVADMLGSNPLKSFLSNFERMEGWITLAHLFAYFILLTSVFRTWNFWKRFFQVSAGVSMIVALGGFGQLPEIIKTGAGRLDAYFGNATYLAVYMLFHIFITIILMARYAGERKEKGAGAGEGTPWYADWIFYGYTAVVVVQVIILFYTATRGSILGLIGGLVLSAILVGVTEKHNKVLRKIGIGIIVFIVAVVGLFFAFKNSDFVKNNSSLSRFANISASDNTTKARFMIWNMAWQGVTQDTKHFVIGWGQESFNYIFSKYYDPGMYGQEQWFDRSHNVFFDWLTAGGVLGLLSYLSLFGLTVFAVWKSAKLSSLEKSLLTGLLAGYFFHNLFVFDNLISYIMFFTIIAYAHIAIESDPLSQAPTAPVKNIKKTAEQEKDDYEAGLYFQYSIIVLTGIIFIFVFYQYNYKGISANLSLMNALTQRGVMAANSKQLTGGYNNENVQAFKDVFAYDTIGKYEAREQLLSNALSASNGASEQKVKQDLLNLAQFELQKQLQETPEDLRYYVLGGNFYQNAGDTKKALELFKKAEKLSPNKQTMLFALGSNYFAQSDYTNALATFKKAYELDKSFDDAKKFYALVALYSGQDKITNDLLGPGPIMDARFLGAYKSLKKYDLMMVYLNKEVENAVPGDVDAQTKTRISLAAGYMTIGDSAKAIKVLEGIKPIVATKTDTVAQIDKMIAEIRAGRNPFEQIK